MNAIETILEDYESPFNVEYNEPCPECDSEAEYLGTLGCLRWYRCRGCGIEFNIL